MSDKFKKQIEFKTIDDEKGEVEAVFSVFNNVDTDGDVVLPGSIKSGFKDNQVPMVFAHKWDQPIGKGIIESDDEKATFRGSFFMGTEAGREAYALAKEMGDLQEWSFGFRINDYESGKFKKDGEETEFDVRFLKDLEVYEVSPVLVGANRETYTLAIKSGEEAIYESSEEKAAMDEDIFDNQEDAEKRAEELGPSQRVGRRTLLSRECRRTRPRPGGRTAAPSGRPGAQPRGTAAHRRRRTHHDVVCSGRHGAMRGGSELGVVHRGAEGPGRTRPSDLRHRRVGRRLGACDRHTRSRRTELLARRAGH